MVIRSRTRHVRVFLIGSAFGMVIFQMLLWVCLAPNKIIPANRPQSMKDVDLYEEILADNLFHKVKVLCWIMISPKFHRTRGVHIKNTWGKRCNKLLFMSSIVDPELDSIALPVTERITHLWSKTKEALKYISEHHLDDADWFLKADEDTFVVLENLRHMLYQYRPQTSLYFGNRLTNNQTLDGYMQGGAYVLSRKAVEKFVKHYPNCRRKDAWAEDLYLGQCLTNRSIFVDTRDDLKQDTFLTSGIKIYYPTVLNRKSWLIEISFYDIRIGTLSCCSDMVASIHEVKNIREMYVLEYLIYHVHPYGIAKNLSETLPKKLSLKEILDAADVGSESKHYVKHKVFHDMEASEIF